MWRDFCAYIFIVVLQLDYSVGNHFNETGCRSEPSCIRCGVAGCIKCPNMIVYPSRKCVNICPFGYRLKWSTMVDYMGQMCIHSGYLLGLSPATLAVLTGIFCGTVLCVLIIVAAVFYVKNKRKNLPQSIETNSDLDDSPERRDFVKQLETLRPYANTFLDMLNDTRRQLRESHKSGNNAAASAYKPLVRDLAKILLLLNRPVDKLIVPDDWEHLFNWAEKALRRFKRMSEISQPQVAQLINFLQSPVVATEPGDNYSVRGSKIMSTFKPEQSFGSSLSLQEKAKSNGNNCNSTFTSPLNPQWQFDYPLVTINPLSMSEFMPTQWKNSKEYLHSPYFLEEDFFQLGFRPQDEITTEL